MPLQPNGHGVSPEEDISARALRAFGQQMYLPEVANVPPNPMEELGTIAHLHQIGEWLRRSQELLNRPLASPALAPRGVMEAFVKTCQRWRLSEHEQSVLLGYGTSPRLAHEMISGRYTELSQDVRDRAGYVVGISVGLGAVFDEAVQAELDWLLRPHPKLANRTPLSMMLMGHMAQLITISNLVSEERALR